MNQLQALAMNEGQRWKRKLWSKQGRPKLEKLALAPWASRRRQELLELLDRLNPSIDELTAAVEQEAHKRPEALRLMTHPGVGPITALAYVLIIGTTARFPRGKQIGAYIGMIPSEESSGDKTTAGAHHQRRQFLIALLASGGSPSSCTYQPGVETPVHPLGDTSAQEHCQGRDGPQNGGSFVLDVAEWL
jgi:transposase